MSVVAQRGPEFQAHLFGRPHRAPILYLYAYTSEARDHKRPARNETTLPCLGALLRAGKKRRCYCRTPIVRSRCRSRRASLPPNVFYYNPRHKHDHQHTQSKTIFDGGDGNQPHRPAADRRHRCRRCCRCLRPRLRARRKVFKYENAIFEDGIHRQCFIGGGFVDARMEGILMVGRSCFKKMCRT